MTLSNAFLCGMVQLENHKQMQHVSTLSATVEDDHYLDVTLRCKFCINIVADHAHPFMEIVFHDG